LATAKERRTMSSMPRQSDTQGQASTAADVREGKSLSMKREFPQRCVPPSPLDFQDVPAMSRAFGDVLARESQAAHSGGRHIPSASYAVAGSGLSAGCSGLSAADILHLSGSSAEAVPSARSRSLMDRLFGKGGWLIPDFRRVATAATLAVALQNALVPQAAWADPFTENVSDGAIVSGETVSLSGGDSSGSVQTVISGGSAVDGTVISGGSQILRNLGSAIRMILGLSGRQYISNGGVATDTTISSGGTQHISDGGQATSTTIHDNARQFVSGGGLATSTTVDGNAVAAGSQVVLTSGSATDTTLNNRGTQIVSSGGSVARTTINSGGRQYVSGGQATSTTVYGYQSAVSKGVLTDTIIYTGGTQDVNDASADRTTLSGGTQFVHNGGTATSTTIHGGVQHISSGFGDSAAGSASGTVIYGGNQSVHSSGAASDTILNGGYQNVDYEATVDNTLINGGYQVIRGSATGTTISGGYQIVYGSEGPIRIGQATETVVHSGGTQVVATLGQATSTTVSSGGSQVVRDGGVAMEIDQKVGGNIYVIVDGADMDTVADGINASGVHFWMSEGVASNFILYDNGSQGVRNGGLANDTIINGGGQHISNAGLATNTIMTGGSQVVSNGGQTISTVVNGGVQMISSGGLATSTVVNNGGRLSAYLNGTVEDVTINRGGSMNVDGSLMDGAHNMLHEGGILTGTTVELLTGANLTIERETDGTQSNAFTGDGSLTKTGAGVLTLTGVNTYTGGTTVAAGTLKGDTIGVQGDILNNADVIFDQPVNGTYSGQMSGTGNLTKTESGWLEMVNANTFGGDLRILKGGIVLGGGGTLTGARSLYLAPGTTLDYSAAAAHATLGTSPMALKNVTVAGLGTMIVPGQGAGGGANFNNGDMYFLIPWTARNGDIFLTVNGDADLRDVNVHLEMMNSRSGRSLISVGEKLILVDVTGDMQSNMASHEVQVTNGDKYIMETNADQLYLTLVEANPNNPEYPRLGAYALTRIAQVAFLDQGYDLLLHQGMKTAQAATAGPGIKIASFGGIGGGWSRYKTGSHVEVSGPQLVLGVAVGTDVYGSNNADAPIGRATGGVFFESGWGGHNTFENFRQFASVKGSGDISYYGGGLLGRYDVKQGPLAGLYAEASGRVGWSSLDFHTSNISYNGWNARFNTSAVYYGAHGGVGYLWSVPGTNGKGTLDASAKMLWTHLENDTVTVYRDRVHFYDADSLRLRLGGRFTYAATETISPYVGAYWEQQFDGTQRMTVNGNRTASPTLHGHTGIGELGVTITPSKTLPISIDLGLQGYAGRREGGTASIQVRVDF